MEEQVVATSAVAATAALVGCHPAGRTANRRANYIHCKDSPATGQGGREVIFQEETERGVAQPMGEPVARASKAWERS